jgi:hypothetical protein
VLRAAVTAASLGSVWSSYARPYTATFARHETFHPRYGWLKKCVDLIDRNPTAFADEDVHMDLGVGKNMAHAIRYWCEAFGLISPAPSGRAGRGVRPEGSPLRWEGYQLTTTARDLIAGAQALDPYLESTATLWWLHYKLIQTQKATTWNFVIDHFGRPTFTAEQLLEDLKRFVQVTYPDHKVAESSLAKDVQLFLRMYAFDDQGTGGAGGRGRHDAVGGAARAPFHEDSIDSPFVELGLLNKRGELYSFVTGSKPTLPDAVIAAAVLDFASVTLRPSPVSPLESLSKRDSFRATDVALRQAQGDENTGSKSISFTELMSADASPVKAFRLTENALYDALERVISASSSPSGRRGQGVRDLFISDTAGVKQLSWKGEPQKLAYQLLKKYYNHALS